MAARPPNLIFFLTDEQRADTLAVYGNTRIQTPNLNQLAERSVVFRSCYAANPLCSPSRASLLTGLYPHTHGTIDNDIPLDPKVPTFLEMLQPAGYATGYFGKWHLGGETFRQRGFSESDSTEDYEHDSDGPSSGYSRLLIEHGIAPDMPGGHSQTLANQVPRELSKPAYVAQRAAAFLDEYRERPFALFLSFVEPHNFGDHLRGPLRNHNDDLYDPASMEVPATFYLDMDRTVSYHKQIARVQIQRGEYPYAYPRSVREFREGKARYWGLITLVDEMVGRVLTRLGELGLDDNTMIVFTSDHGDMLGDHRLMSKVVEYEESVKVPCLLRMSGQRRQMIVSQRVSQVDLAPTLLELMGQPVPAHLQGRSMAPCLREDGDWPALRQAQDRPCETSEGRSEPGRGAARDVIIEFVMWPALELRHLAHGRTIITQEGWKLSANEFGGGELYDLRADPQEMANLLLWDCPGFPKESRDCTLPRPRAQVSRVGAGLPTGPRAGTEPRPYRIGAARPLRPTKLGYEAREGGLAVRLRSWQRATGDPLALNLSPIPQWPADWIEVLRRKDIDLDRDLNRPWPDT